MKLPKYFIEVTAAVGNQEKFYVKVSKITMVRDNGGCTGIWVGDVELMVKESPKSIMEMCAHVQEIN